MTMTSPKSFADATTIKQLSSHTYSADFPSDWCIGNGRLENPHVLKYLTMTSSSARRFRNLLLPPSSQYTFPTYPVEAEPASHIDAPPGFPPSNTDWPRTVYSSRHQARAADIDYPHYFVPGLAPGSSRLHHQFQSPRRERRHSAHKIPTPSASQQRLPCCAQSRPR